MKSQFIWLLIFLLVLFILIVLTEILHRRFQVRSENSRKFLHVSGGLTCLLFPSIFTNHWWLLILASVAFSILFITYKTKQLASVHQTRRYSIGSILFPIPVYLCFLMAEIAGDNLFFYLPVSLLAISDTAAEIGGNLWGRHTTKFFNRQKTLAGSLSFLVTSLIVCIGWFNTNTAFTLTDIILFSLIISLCAAITETITLHGWDNLSVPAITVLLLLFFLTTHSDKIR